MPCSHCSASLGLSWALSKLLSMPTARTQCPSDANAAKRIWFRRFRRGLRRWASCEPSRHAERFLGRHGIAPRSEAQSPRRGMFSIGPWYWSNGCRRSQPGSLALLEDDKRSFVYLIASSQQQTPTTTIHSSRLPPLNRPETPHSFSTGPRPTCSA
jgi:hypothetical protein